MSSSMHARSVAPAAGRRRIAQLGRPRDENIDAQVVSAVLQVLRTRGYRAVTIERIARKVGTARTTIYRRWPSKRRLVAYTVLNEMGASPAADTGTLRGDLEAAARTLLHAFAGPLRQALAGLVTDMAHDPELAASIREDVLAARRKSMHDALQRARARREVRDDLDTELVLDMLTGPFYYRALFGHAEITPRMTREVVEYVLRIAVRA